MKRILSLSLALLLATPCSAENYLLSGGQESKIQYEMLQKVQPSSNTRKLILNYVLPESFDSPTYCQKIEQFDIRFTPSPDDRLRRPSPCDTTHQGFPKTAHRAV